MRLQRLQGNAFPKFVKQKSFRFTSSFTSSSFKVGARQAVCPFCYKAFYDKSTMNRHVSKRVCLGLNYPNMSQLSVSQEQKPELRDENISPEGITKSTVLKPCPYCNKLLKGTRGVRKHIDYYGCPMAIARTQEKDMLQK